MKARNHRKGEPETKRRIELLKLQCIAPPTNEFLDHGANHLLRTVANLRNDIVAQRCLTLSGDVYRIAIVPPRRHRLTDNGKTISIHIARDTGMSKHPVDHVGHFDYSHLDGYYGSAIFHVKICS